MPKVGETLALSVQLFDGDETKFVRAILEDASGAALPSSPVTLSHVSSGRYENSSITMPSTAYVAATYEVYDDAAFTTLSDVHSFAIDTFPLEIPFTEILDALDAITDLLNDIKMVGLSVIGQMDITATIEDAQNITAKIDDATVITAKITDDETLQGDIDSDSQSLSVNLDDESKISAEIEEC